MQDKINKKLCEEEQDRRLEEQFMKEYQFIEEGLSFDEPGSCHEESDEEIEEAYEKLVARLQTEGAYREESGRNVKSGIKRMNICQWMKAAGIAIVCALGLCAGMMNNHTNNNQVVKTIKLLAGEDIRIASGNREVHDRSRKASETDKTGENSEKYC